MAAEVTIAVPFLIMLLVFVGVVVHRGVDARIRVDDAAHQAARAASIERTTTAATTAAQTTAADALAQAGVACVSVSTTTTATASTTTASTNTPSTNTAAGELQPGGVVSVTVSCQVDLGAALLLGVPTSKTVSATAVEPIDQYRSAAYTIASAAPGGGNLDVATAGSPA